MRRDSFPKRVWPERPRDRQEAEPRREVAGAGPDSVAAAIKVLHAYEEGRLSPAPPRAGTEGGREAGVLE